MNIDPLALALLLLLLLLLLLCWVLDGVICVPLNFLAKKSIFNFQSRIYLWLCWVRIHRRTHLLFSWYLSRQNALKSLYEPAIDSLIVCKLNLTQVDLLSGIYRHTRHDFLPRDACSFLWSGFLLNGIQWNLWRTVWFFVINLVLKIIVEGRAFWLLRSRLVKSPYLVFSSLFFRSQLLTIASLNCICRVEIRRISLLLLLMVFDLALICTLSPWVEMVCLLILSLLLLHYLNMGLICLRIALVHQYSTVLLVSQSHYTCFVVYYIEKFVYNLLIFYLNILGNSIDSLFTMNCQASFDFAPRNGCLLLSLLLLNAVNLVH